MKDFEYNSSQNPFWIWLLSLLLLVSGMYYLFEAGILTDIREKDATFISFMIIAVMFAIHGKLGYHLFNKVFKSTPIEERFIDLGYETCEHMLAAGMLGTIIGFIMMTTSFTTVDFTNVANIGQLFTLATKGMSTALYTTVVGLMCSMFTRASHYVVLNMRNNA